MLAYLNDPKVKKLYVSRVKAHVKADEIVKGIYWEEGKGCAVGCTIHSNKHSAYETELGIPQMLARLEDQIFEGASNAWAKTWPERFLKAITPGADLSKAGWQFQHWLLLDPKDGAIRFAREQDKELFKTIGGLIWDLALGKQIDESAAESVARSAAWSARSAAESVARSVARSAAWSARSAAESVARSAESAAWSAESAAWSAAWSAESTAWSVARSAAWSAAESVARSAAWSAESVARSVAWSAESAAWSAESAAWSAESAAESVAWSAYERQGEKLLELLKAAKPPKKERKNGN